MTRQVELSVGQPPDPSWKRPPGRPRSKWTDQLRRDNNNVPIATLWRQAIGRGTQERRYGPSRLRIKDDDVSPDGYNKWSLLHVVVYSCSLRTDSCENECWRALKILQVRSE